MELRQRLSLLDNNVNYMQMMIEQIHPCSNMEVQNIVRCIQILIRTVNKMRIAIIESEEEVDDEFEEDLHYCKRNYNFIIEECGNKDFVKIKEFLEELEINYELRPLPTCQK